MKYFKYMLFVLMLFVSINMRGQYNPENPIEPGVYYTMTLKSFPEDAGSFNINRVTSYSEGTNVRIRAYNGHDYKFVAWEEDGYVISKESELIYTMPSRNVVLTAHYKYDPNSPSEPDMPVIKQFSTLRLKLTPSEAGYLNIGSGNKYEVGSSVTLCAYSYYNFVFDKWTENGEVISTTYKFNYVMKDNDPELVAHYKYNPGNPEEPSIPKVYSRLYLECDPVGGGSFNTGSGNEYKEGTSIYLRAYSNQYYKFKNWTLNGEIISNKYDFYFTMPDKDTRLVAHYDYCYDPSNPGEPSEPDDNTGIYGMTENAVRGQLTHYPIYFENKEKVFGLVFDIQFPEGFVVNKEDIVLSSRISTHELTITDLGENNYRLYLLGNDYISGNNGKLLEIPVSIPETAVMGEKYPVKLSHGVIVNEDKSEIPVSVRSGNLLVEKISEDGLYARFSYDKLNNRVKFINLSSNKATRYEWDFGDGTSSKEKEPLHLFDASGTYNVRLTSFGEYDKDVAELTVIVNDKKVWKVEGNFYLSDKVLGARYFTTVDSLLDFLDSSSVSGNIGLSLLADKSFESKIQDKNINKWKKLFNSLSLVDSKLVLRKWKSGRNPNLLLGLPNETINTDFVDVFTKNYSRIVCEGVEIKFWGVTYNPYKIYLLKNQNIHSGENTEGWDFSSISPDLNFTWTAGNVPEGVYGAVLEGKGKIPPMNIRNLTNEKFVLTYTVIGDYKGSVFCKFTKEIEITPELVGMFTKMSPANGFVSESTTITLTWNDIKNAVYDVYLWNADNPFPNKPVAEGISDIRYVSDNFCQNGNTYKWQVVARNENQKIASDTLLFSVRSLPDLHIYELNCSEAIAGEKLTVEWVVKNDGLGSTGNVEWNDYIWLVTDVYGGTKPSLSFSNNNSKLLATIKNVKSLDVGESYNNKVDVYLDERVYGNYYLIVASDMYSISDIDWGAIGGSVINPYNPVQDGTGYKHLYASTTASYNKLYEKDETETYSDNFFYKAIDIAIPPLADLQIPKIKAYVIPDEEPDTSKPDGNNTDLTNNKYITWQECYAPTPITAAGLRKTETFYSGKKIAVEITVANKGGKITDKPFRISVLMSSSENREEASLISLGTVHCPKYLNAAEDTTLTFAFYMPYEWHGDTYFYANADIDDNVYELANIENNWGKSDKYDVLLCPGADFVVKDFLAPDAISSTSPFEVTYHVSNVGAGIPYNGNWVDKIYLSKNKTGLDDSAVLLSSKEYSGKFECRDKAPVVVLPSGMGLVEPEYFDFKGDDYDGKFVVTPSGMPSGNCYLYLKLDADDNVYEYDGEDNNVVCLGNVKFVQPDLSAELISVSDDTLSTGQEFCFTWKIKNTGLGNLHDIKIKDAFYSSVNQDGSDAVLLGTVENVLWIASGSEKTLKANVKIPSMKGNDGLRYIFVKTNVENTVSEESLSNNISPLFKTWFKYDSRKPIVKGVNLYINNFSFVDSIKPGEQTQINYIVHNNGEKDVPYNEVLHEVYISQHPDFDKTKAVKCKVLKQIGNAGNLLTGNEISIIQTVLMPDNIIGGYNYIYVFVDPNNDLHERDVRDNKSSDSFYLNGNIPDLEPQDIILSDTIYTSVDVTMNYTIFNKGEWDSGPFWTDIYLSRDKILDKNDIQLVNEYTDVLLKNERCRKNAHFKVKDNIYGKWYVLVICDKDDRTTELNENNNVKAIPVDIIQSPLPDMSVNIISTDKQLIAGHPINISSVIENIGTHATRTDKWSDTYYLSSNTVLDVNDAIMIGSKMHSGILDVGGCYNNVVTFNLPPNVQGNYMLFVLSDASNSITEPDENNNQKGVEIYINGSDDMPADLLVSNINIPSVIKAGEEVTYSYDILNIGEFAASGNINDVIYMSKDSHWDKDDVMIGVVKGKDTIQPGNKVTRTVQGCITNMPEGDYYIIIKTNSTNTISEQIRDNNTAATKFPCKLSFNKINLSGNVIVNTLGYYKLDIPNGYEGKTVGLYLDHPEEAAAGVYVSYGKVPSTAKYDFATTSLEGTEKELLIPNVKAGVYYILAQDNRDFVNLIENYFKFHLFSENETNKVSTIMNLKVKEVNFGATNLSVKQGGNGGWVSTEINGALLDSIMDFRLQSGNNVIPIENLTFESMTHTRATFNLNMAKIGTYDIVSELPNGKQAILPDEFKVVTGASVKLGVKIDAPGYVRMHSYTPITVSYANGGNTDIYIYKLMLVISEGYLGTSIKDLDRHQSVLYLDLDTVKDSRGYSTIAPGVQKTVNIFMYQSAPRSHMAIYLVK